MDMWRKLFTEDPALLAMGLVPARSVAAAAFVNGAALSWRTAWAVTGIGLVLLFAAFWSTIVHTATVWYDSATFNHGFLILPICAYLMWLKRGSVASMAPRPCWWGVPLMLLCGVAWLVGHAASVAFVQQTALLGMIYGLFLAVFGIAVIWRMAFPLFYLVFAVPFGEFLIAPLQDFTAQFIVKGMRLLDIPIFLDGVFLSIPTGNFEVAEACAGLRFLIASIALGFLFAHITYSSWIRRAIFVGLAMTVPVIANGFRAFGIVLIAYYTDHKVAVGVDHIVYGWIFFAIVTLILLAIGMTFRDDAPEATAPDVQVMHRSAAHAGSPRQIATVAAAALACAVVSPIYARVLDAQPLPPLAAPLAMPTVGGGWQAADGQRSDWTPVFANADRTLLRSYVKDGHQVQLFIAFYIRQRQGAELIHSANRMADGTGWSRTASGTARARVDGAEHTVETTRMLNRGRARMSYHWYWVAGRYTADPYVAKALQAFDRLRGGGAAAAIAISAPYDQHPAQAAGVLRDFLAVTGPFRPVLEQSARQ